MTKDADYTLSEDKSNLENAYRWSSFLKRNKTIKNLNTGRKDHSYISQILSDLSLSYG